MRSGIEFASGVLLSCVLGCGGASSTSGDANGAGSSAVAAGAGHGGSNAANGDSSNAAGSSNADAGNAGTGAPPGAGSGGTSSNTGGSNGLAGGAGANAGAGGSGGGATLDLTDYGSGTCTDFKPCGGNPTGSWKIDSVCADPPLKGLAALCPSAKETISMTGSLTFAASHTYTSMILVNIHDSVPASCVADLGGCGATTGALTRCNQVPAGDCECDSSSAVTPPPDATWVASDTHLVLGASVAFFCQTGNQLLLRSKTSSGIFVYQLAR